jgi:hypothetical protein
MGAHVSDKEYSPGFRLFVAGVVGMVALLALLGGGLWAFSPDLLDGAPPKPWEGPAIGPQVLKAGFSAKNLNPPPSPLEPPPADTEAASQEKDKPKDEAPASPVKPLDVQKNP